MDRGTRWVRWFLPGSLAAIVALGLCTGRAEAASGKQVLVGAGVASFNDDNILQYSRDQIAQFQSGLAPDRFSIRSADDRVLRPSLSLALENRMKRGRSWRLSLRGGGEFHDKNKTADRHSMSAEWRQSFSRATVLTLRGYYLPGFYLRQLFDDDAPAVPTRYRRAVFALATGSLALKQRIKPGYWAGLAYRYEHRDYNPDFVERNSATHQAVGEVTWTRLPGRGSLALHGGYRRTDAKVADGDELPGAPPDDPDIGYHGVLAGLDGRVDLARGRDTGVVVSFGYELGTRDYTSKQATDRYHFGRNDVSHSVDVGLAWSPWRRWSLQGSYSYQQNAAHLGSAAPPSSEVGSYRENRVGLGVEWWGILWRGASRPETPDTNEEP